MTLPKWQGHRSPSTSTSHRSLPMIDTDYRIGGMPVKYLVTPERALINVPDEIRKCVAFLTYRRGSGKEVAAATAFFVRLATELNDGRGFAYLVTAAHVIDGIRDRHAREVNVRVNL